MVTYVIPMSSADLSLKVCRSSHRSHTRAADLQNRSALHLLLQERLRYSGSGCSTWSSHRIDGGGAQDTCRGDDAPGEIITMGCFENSSRQHGSKELPQRIGHDDNAENLSQRCQAETLG